MRYLLTIFILVGIGLSNDITAQNTTTVDAALTGQKKGSHAILEIRLNKEDEFRTLDGSSSSVTRVAIFNGENQEKQIVSRKFEGFNDVIKYLNQARKLGWKVKETYQVKGESLLIIHYLLYKKK